MKTVAIISHGCKLNQYEGEAIEESFSEAGFRIVDQYKGTVPDIIIVNTCTVTEKSDRKSRNTILRASRIKPKGGLLVVTGCYAQTDRDTLKAIEGVDLVIGNTEKPNILDTIQTYINGNKIVKSKSISPFYYPDPRYPKRSRAFVKIQDGCSGSCSFCKVPIARGRSKSRDYNDIKSYVMRLSEKGYREVVLTGINLGDYKWQDMTLSDLLFQLLKCTKNLRIRLSSIEPPFFEKELFSIIGDKRIAPHFHIPLQSGSDRILRLMKRPYTIDEYKRIISKLKKARPKSHIATDVIVGFPTENEEDFRNTVEVIEEIGFASLHVFKYSKRKGTGVAKIGDDITYQTKVQRSNQLIKLGEMLNYQYRSHFLGKKLPAIFERYNRGWQGVTDNYIKVRLEGLTEQSLDREIFPIRITRVENNTTYGVLACGIVD
ncbi:MAG: tRNA (N(6)-L-threonylcarbamoyladenosine(37)-C(2))-methylthiotransferase MtaB [Spirochaetota bacterium]|nr:MAG: tRNA (N(6)-L-threonylcarbamoyladenosine(37)-C(2))-methylthiotransferase MtaB [Spirochaetota bacterium]